MTARRLRAVLTNSKSCESRIEESVKIVRDTNDTARFASVYSQAWQEAAKRPPQWSFAHLARRCEELLRGVDVENRTVLDVGAGDGFLSHYLAIHKRAKAILSIDEYEGRGAETDLYGINLALQRELADSDKVSILKCDINELPSGVRADLVVFVNSLHHIICCGGRLRAMPKALSKAVALFARLESLLSNNGEILIQEVSRYNLCPLPQYRRRFQQVDWKSKQSAGEWSWALRRAGFDRPTVRYRLPLILPNKALLRRVFDNRLASMLTDSSYIIRARRQGPQ
jgi:SAM-dependent methyltransferase